MYPIDNPPIESGYRGMKIFKPKKTNLSEVKAELNRIAEGIEKLVYIAEFQIKAAGSTITYPRKEK